MTNEERFKALLTTLGYDPEMQKKHFSILVRHCNEATDPPTQFSHTLLPSVVKTYHIGTIKRRHYIELFFAAVTKDIEEVLHTVGNSLEEVNIAVCGVRMGAKADQLGMLALMGP